MKIDIKGTHYDIGEPNELSALLLEVVMNNGVSPTPIGTMIGIEMFRIGTTRVLKAMAVDKGEDPMKIDEQMEKLWGDARRIAEELYSQERRDRWQKRKKKRR